MKSNFKETMNLPATTFPMRANLPENEPKRLAKWSESNLYKRVLDLNKDGEPFILHDGPPYANGPIHIGHAFNKILKDIVIKSHSQMGYYTPYIPGWDCHGQPIEHMVEVTLGPEKMAKIDQSTLRRLCRDWATKYVNVQRDGFKSLGVLADWEHPYLTYDKSFETGNVEVFKEMFLNGSIYQGRKPIHWCKRCHTALAEAEIEYKDVDSTSIYVMFELKSIPNAFAPYVKHAHVAIWTTTPWTLPANTAVCVSPSAKYCMVAADGNNLLMAKDLVESLAEEANWQSWAILCGNDGKEILVDGIELCETPYKLPFRDDFDGTIIYGEHVTLDTGTGAVHTAPGHGQDDYIVANKFNVALVMPVDDNGCFTKEAAQFEGMDINEANPVIIKTLEDSGALISSKVINHSYPHCWRCKRPVIFRATSQWFVSMAENGLQEKALHAIQNDVEWIPKWALNRISSMVGDRPDWCISRQRSWGVPIPVFSCKNCGEILATEESFDAVISLFDKEGADAWFTKDPSEYLPASCKCSKCEMSSFVPEKDILDVWWESGVSHTSVCKHRKSEGMRFPADMYLEGSDQHRGWFQSSLLTSVGAYGCAPYKSVMHCGFTVDSDGRKMSKSLGNGVDPADVLKKYGADVLRLWVCSVDYSQDVNIGDEILARTSDTYRKIRNTMRFLLANLYDFNEETDLVKNIDDLSSLDRWALARLGILLDDINKFYKSYKFHQIYRSVYEYMVSDLSSVYLDACKDRLYSEAATSPLRRSCQTVLANILHVLVRVLYPVLSFTCDEVWEHFPAGLIKNNDVSVALAGWPKKEDFVPYIDDATTNCIISGFEAILELREQATKALEDARSQQIINKSQEAHLEVGAPRDYYDCFQKYDSAFYEELLIVSSVKFVEADCLEVKVELSSDEKCPRCWNYKKLSKSINDEMVCDRCARALGI